MASHRSSLRCQHDFHTLTAPHPFQVALTGALGLPDEFYAQLWCEYAALSAEDDTAFGERLMLKAGVAGVPGSVFYPSRVENPKRIRFTFSKSRNTIEEAARRLTTFRP